MTISTVIENPGFELGDSGWDKGANVTIGTSVPGLSTTARTGSYFAGCHSSTGGSYETYVWNQNKAGVIAGQAVTARCWGSGSGKDGNAIAVRLEWTDESGGVLLTSVGEETPWNSPAGWYESTVSAVAPTGAAYVRIGAFMRVRANGGVWVDDFSWSYTNNRTVELTSPAASATYVEGSNVKLAVTITGSSPQIIKVEYLDGTEVIASTATPNYGYNINTLAVGTHVITANVYLSDGTTLTTAAHTITVAAYVPPPVKREFKASNSYAYLITGGFYGLTAGMPATALVTGVEVELDYKLSLLVRSKDLDIDDPLGSTANVIFDITNGGSVETILLTKDSTSYTKVGSAVVTDVPIDLIDFTQTETGLISDNKKWTVFTSTDKHVTTGSAETLYGQAPIPAADFVNNFIGLRFYPNLNAIPDYADSGDACVRFQIDQLRVRVYFDAGSVEYYFVNPAETEIIKGSLVNSYVFTGDFKTADASGVLELKPELVVVAGGTALIGKDWTVHSGNPPTSANKIADVKESVDNIGQGFAYNGLPTYAEVVDKRSRYQFITNNFYGDPALDSMYGVNGSSRAFTYNNNFFHFIFTQPDATLDKPRHVSHHHSHLALGYQEGRVDISVIGEPYNYSGVEGASSWAIGDSVVGLLPLSGALLGIFCKKSIWGISGTTVDNFTTQIISPKLGAIEYTIADMGFPVYANIYGIYTLSQTSQYGDFAGTPMSQMVSPWLRPRLVRSANSNYEVVTAWPVRSKNQYKLAFADGNVLTMTMNYGDQGAPTFSKQRYFLATPAGTDPPPSAYDTSRDAIVPVAVSSELDITGEERIHVANKHKPVIIPNSGTVVLWSTRQSGGGIGFDPALAFNSGLDGAVDVQITSYYLPELAAEPASTYPPPVYPLTVDLTYYTKHTIAPITLTTGNISPGPGEAIWWAPYIQTSTIPDGAFFADVLVDGVTELAVVYNGGGW